MSCEKKIATRRAHNLEPLGGLEECHSSTTMRFENSFGAMELYSEFLTVLGSSVPQCQLENDKFELESLDTIFGTTYSMPWLLLTICLGDSLEATCSDSMFETDRMPVI